MIVWGGQDQNFSPFNTGGRYCGQYPTPSPTPTPTPTPPLTPPNDDFADAIVISTTSGSLVGTNKGSTTQVGEPAGENSVWYRWTAPNNGEAHLRIGMDWLTIDVYTGTAINALTRIATSSGSPSAVNWTAVAGTTYRIRLTKNTRTSAFTLFWSLIPNDAFASAILLTGANGTVTGTNVMRDRSVRVRRTRWRELGLVQMDRTEQREAHFRIGMDWLTIDVYTGTAINALTRIATSSGSPSAVNWTAVAGTTYRIRLTKNTRTSAFMLVWSL